MPWAVNPSISQTGKSMTGASLEANGATVALKTTFEFLHRFLPHCQGQRFRAMDRAVIQGGCSENALRIFVPQRVLFCKGADAKICVPASRGRA
jgi:hypothetical protein